MVTRWSTATAGCCAGSTSRRSNETATELGVRIVSPDRPGLGNSDPAPGRTTGRLGPRRRRPPRRARAPTHGRARLVDGRAVRAGVRGKPPRADHSCGGDRGRGPARRRRGVRAAERDGSSPHSVVPTPSACSRARSSPRSESSRPTPPTCGLTSPRGVRCPTKPPRSRRSPIRASPRRRPARSPTPKAWSRSTAPGSARGASRPKTSGYRRRSGRATPTISSPRRGVANWRRGSPTPRLVLLPGEGHFLGYRHAREILGDLTGVSPGD